MSEKPEQVEVKRVTDPPVHQDRGGLWQRYGKAAFPILGGIVLDCADLATYGPAGLYTGMIVGCIVGWIISDYYAYSTRGRVVFAILAGVYCTMPGTFFLPLATIAAVSGLKRGTGPNANHGKRTRA